MPILKLTLYAVKVHVAKGHRDPKVAGRGDGAAGADGCRAIDLHKALVGPGAPHVHEEHGARASDGHLQRRAIGKFSDILRLRKESLGLQYVWDSVVVQIRTKLD